MDFPVVDPLLKGRDENLVIPVYKEWPNSAQFITAFDSLKGHVLAYE